MKKLGEGQFVTAAAKCRVEGVRLHVAIMTQIGVNDGYRDLALASSISLTFWYCRSFGSSLIAWSMATRAS